MHHRSHDQHPGGLPPGVCLQRVLPPGGSASRGVEQIPPPLELEKWVVHILLECFLIFTRFWYFVRKIKPSKNDNSSCEGLLSDVNLIGLEQINRTVCRQNISEIEKTLQRKFVNGFAVIFGAQTVQAVEKLL